MQELIRLFTKTSPVIMDQASINSFGIQTHPENHRSARFINWSALCRANDTAQLKAEMLRFLQGKESIKTIDDLGREWGYIIPSFFALGDRITKEKAYRIIKESRIEAMFGKDKSLYTDRFTAVADTMLSLMYLKNLSHKDNMDYQSVIKIMSYTEKVIDSNYQLPHNNILEYFERRAMIPHWFYMMDPCGNVVSPNTRFPYLLEQGTENDTGKIKGCVSSNCTCHENQECVKQSTCCAKPRIDLVDLMVVKTYTKCYRAGDISYIKNVLDGEKLSTKHRELNRTEELTESETDVKQFEERYLQTEDKSSLQNEAEDVLKTDKGMDAGLTTNSSFGANVKAVNFGFGTNSTTNFNLSQSKTITNKEVRDYSKDIIARATKQLEQKVRKLSSFKRIHETEENNKHVFNNVSGENINGQYLFVNKISRAQVYNYERVPVIDLILPEPAALYKRLFENKFKGIEPKKPEEIKIQAKDINEKNYESFVSQYGLKDTARPPVRTLESMIHFDGNPGVEKRHVDIERKNIGTKWFPLWIDVPVVRYYGSGSTSNNAEISVPDGYITGSMSSDWGFNLFNGNGITGCYIELKIVGNSIYLNGDNRPASINSVSPMNAYEGTQAVFLTGNNATEFHFDLKVTYKLKEEKFFEWQTSIYNKMVEAYQKALVEYEKAIAAYIEAKNEHEAKEAEAKKARYNKNPFINRETEKAELKRMAISYISCQFYDRFNAMKNKVEPCGYPEMNIREAEEEGKFIQFFEQAFNWNLLTYIFYPYFWGKKCGWGKSLKEEAGDLIFEKFLQAGSCHIQIPIRPTHWDLVKHFIDFGEIWGGSGAVPIPTDPYYVSLAQEIKEQFQNFNAERAGTIDTTNSANTNTVILNDITQHYYDPSTIDNIHVANKVADMEREITIDYKTYRIIDIAETVPASANHSTWVITLERNYEGAILPNLKWSTGAVYIGAPWEFVTPTNLVYLREKSKCLPCYPLKECKE